MASIEPAKGRSNPPISTCSFWPSGPLPQKPAAVLIPVAPPPPEMNPMPLHGATSQPYPTPPPRLPTGLAHTWQVACQRLHSEVVLPEVSQPPLGREENKPPYP